MTVLATAVSTYALDGLATLAGFALAASGLLGGLAPWALVGALVLSYGLWGAGMRVNLRANWALLAATGTSTSVLSKVAHDLARARGAAPRRRRLAASAGYVATEIAKEVPYYAGASGAALADAVSARDAVIFLAGTNLGAAVYEYVLARATRRLPAIRRRAALPPPRVRP